MELWSSRTPETGTIERQVERAEEQGWTGVTFTDSQNLVGDPFVAAALGSRVTERLRFATGVSNLATRHPATVAGTAITVNEESGGRFTLGVGRGDTALFHLGRPPMPVAPFAERLRQVQGYLRGEVVDLDGHPSEMKWLARTRQPKVSLDVAASGPRMLQLAGQVADQVSLAVGADPERVAWAISEVRAAERKAGRGAAQEVGIGAYVNVGCHPDLDVARGLIAGIVAAFTHFSAMPGSTGAGLRDEDRVVAAEVGSRYDSEVHLQNAAEHTGALAPAFVDRFAVVGPPEACIARLQELAALGVDRFVLTGPGFGADRDDARLANQLVASEVLPTLVG